MILPNLQLVRNAASVPALARVLYLPAPRRVGGASFGLGRIVGTTKVKATPNQAKQAAVVLVDKRARLPIAETLSHPVTGAYAFEGFDHTRKYLVLAIDPLTQYTAVIADEVLPQLGS